MYTLLRSNYRLSVLAKWELIWSLPLVVVGAIKILDPLIIGIALFLALIPWGVHWSAFYKPMQRTFLDGALILFVISAFVGLRASYDVWVSLPMLLTLLGSINLFYVIANSTLPKQIGGGLVIVAGFLSLYYIGQVSLILPRVFFIPHPNAVAGFLEGVFLLGVVLSRQTQGHQRWGWATAVAVIACGLLISGSRGSWLGLAVAVGIWALLRAPSWAWRLSAWGLGVLAGLGLGIYAIAHAAISDRYIFIISSIIDTANTRLALYQNSLELLGDYPFTGIGLGDAFAMVYSHYALLILPAYLFYAHNLFLSVALGFGILGLIALIWLLISLYRFVFLVERLGLKGQSLPFFRATWLGATAIFVHGLTDSPHFSNYHWTMPILFAILGLVVAIGIPALRQVDREKVKTIPGQWYKGRSWIKLAVTTVALTIAVVVFQRPLASAWYTNLGAIYQTQADLSNLDPLARDSATTRAVMYFEHALSLNPSQPTVNRRLGMMALDRQDFETAITYLERAYRQDPTNQTTLKALGLTYQWTERFDLAAELLGQLDEYSGITTGPNIWNY